MLTVHEAYKNLKEKKVSSLELTQDCLEKAKNSQCNSYVSITEDSALKKASEADKRIKSGKSRGPLDGIPYSLKDLFVTKGVRTTAGSRYLSNYIPSFDGHISKSLENAGAILVGKAGCDEFGMGSTNENTPFGPVLNPLNHEYVAGGSSGGSAASIAEGSSLFSMGTDTGGSVRQPANFCGITGLKPSYGRVSRYGQIAYASSLDQASPMASSVLDLAYIMDEITEKDVRDATNIAKNKMKSAKSIASVGPSFLKGKKIGYVEEIIDSCDDDVSKNIRNSLDKLKKSGAEIVPVKLPHIKYSVAAYYIIASSEASSNLARYDGIHFGYRSSSSDIKSLEELYVESRSEGLGEEVKNRIMLGTFSLSAGYQDQYFSKACKVRRLIWQDFKSAFENVDVILSPVSASTAFKRGDIVKDILKMYISDFSTIPANLAGLPALALPDGKGNSGLPSGFQLMSKAFSEEILLKFGRAFELIG